MPSNVLDIFKNRRSIQRYSSKEVSDQSLFKALEAARWAPSAHNSQPWRFTVIRDLAVKRKLAEAMASRWEKDMSKNGVPSENRESRIKTSVEQFTNAPIVIIVCLTMEEMDKYPDKQRQKTEHIMAVQSVAAAIENMLLAAHAEGLGSCWYCAPLFCPDTVRNVLKIPRHVEPQALITIGYPVNKPNPPPRKPLGKIVCQNCWR